MKLLTFMICVISFVCVLFLPHVSGEEMQENIYYAPLTNPNTAEKFTVEDQQYLCERAGDAVRLIPDALMEPGMKIPEYRESQGHHILKEKWVALPVESLPVPEKFRIVVDFNPTQTKGVYVGFERIEGESQSKTGTPLKGFLAREEALEWMIRVYVKKENL